MPGIVFDTRVSVGASFCLLGIVFDTYVSVGASFCLLGIVFDTRDCVGAFPFGCWVSFSIPVLVFADSFLVLRTPTVVTAQAIIGLNRIKWDSLPLVAL